MTATSQQLQEWLNAKEDEHLEFKEAKANFHFDKLVRSSSNHADMAGEPSTCSALSVTTLAASRTRSTAPPRRPCLSNISGKIVRTGARWLTCCRSIRLSLVTG